MGPQPVAGYVEPHKGSFISLESGGKAKTHLTKVGISNGLAWSMDNKFFYYIDSHKKTVDQYEFDLENGLICMFKTIKTNKTFLFQQMAKVFSR